MSNPFEQEKRNYDATPIPEELDERVRAGIAQGRRRAAARRRFRSLAGAAACMVVMVGALNVSPAFAAAAAEVPVVGGVFRVLTVRNYQETNGDRTLTVEQPVVEGESALSRFETIVGYYGLCEAEQEVSVYCTYGEKPLHAGNEEEVLTLEERYLMFTLPMSSLTLLWQMNHLSFHSII